MLEMWGAEEVFAGEGSLPCVAPGPYTLSADVDHHAFGVDSLLGAGWGLAAGALAGVATYAGVRLLLDRNAHGSSGGPGQPASPPADRTDPPIDIGTALTPTGGPDPESEATLLDEEGEAAQLIEELIILYDLEQSDTLKRRIVRSLAKVGVRIDEASAVPFDPSRHDAMGTVPAAAGVAPGTVVDVVRPGFVRASGHVVRATEVVVATDADGAW